MNKYQYKISLRRNKCIVKDNVYVLCWDGKQEPQMQDIVKAVILKMISKISLLMVSNHPLRKTM